MTIINNHDKVGPSEDELMSEELGKNQTFIRKLELLFNTKTRFCKHKSPDCVTNAVQGFISNFKIGLKIRFAITIIQLLLRKSKLNKISIVD